MRMLIGFCVLAISACTSSMWMPNYQIEEITGIHVDQSTRTLFVSSEHNGYVFSVDADFFEVLLLSRQIEYTSRFGNFVVDRDHRVNGDIRLHIRDSDIDAGMQERLRELGFGDDSDVPSLLERTQHLSGRMYEIEGELPMRKLDPAIRVRIVYPESYSASATKIVATPATIAVDAAVVLPTMLLGVLAMGASQTSN